MQDKSAAGGGFALRVAASFNTTLQGALRDEVAQRP